MRARHNELTQIEHTLAELGELYQRLAEEVIVHEDRIEVAENNAQKTVDNMEQGNEQVKRASDHARAPASSSGGASSSSASSSWPLLSASAWASA